MPKPIFLYDPAHTDPTIRAALERFAEDFPVRPADRGQKANVALTLGGAGPKLEHEAGVARVSGPTLPMLMRSLATLRAIRHANAGPRTIEETARFDTLGFMLDCSRNAVPTVATVKKYLRRVAAMGFNLVMLYTEDTYEVPGEPYIGYLRGRFTQHELREIDDYAHALGVEMMPCIQTLAHLSQMLRWWKRFADVKGSGDFLYVGQPKTYELLEKMIAAACVPYRSKRIHVGMDEAHGIGHGRHKAIPGVRTEFDIMIEHLKGVTGITDRLGLSPMMWSDMWFSIAGGSYYNTEAVVPDDVAKRIPASMSLVYWDYYHYDPEHYSKMIALHRKMGREPIFAPGAWTDYVFWTHFTHARLNTDAGMLACKRERVRRAFTTLWGDNGGSCDFMSALPALQHFAEHGFRDTVSDDDLRTGLRGSSDIDFDAFDTGRQNDITPNLAPTIREWCDHLGTKVPAFAEPVADKRGWDVHGTNPSIYLLWQDPMLGIYDGHIEDLDIASEYKLVASNIAKARKAGPIEHRRLAFAYELARVLELKGPLGVDLLRAYWARDKRRLRQIADKTLPELLRRVGKAHEAHRRSWFEQNKPHGWEVIDQRWAGLAGRLKSARMRLKDYLAGRVKELSELDEQRLPVSDFPKGRLGYGGPSHRAVISASVIT